jgi:diguanylate cyclase (GGDEF)-like protein/PAS domain S-box-containing protein
MQERAIRENVLDGIITMDEHGLIQSCNPAAERMFGYAPGELVNQPVTLLMPDADAAHHQQHVQTYLASGRERVLGMNRDVTGRCRNDREIMLSIGVTEIRSNGKRLFIAALRDITEQREAERVLKRSQAELESLVEQRTRELNESNQRLRQEIDRHKRTQAELEHMARHDSLTHLPNRSLFTEHLRHNLARARRRELQTALLFIDLDGFKPINDNHGHEIGDHLLQAVARRLAAVTRSEDLVARIGGDEFTLVLAGEPEIPDQAITVATKIIQALGEPFEVDNLELRIGASIGISLYPADGTDAATLIRNADSAMFQAKAAGPNQFRFYTRALTEAVDHKRRLEMDLRQAVEQGQLHLVYQPQVDLETGEPNGVEVLVRWHHPEFGPISPGEFIPVAEETHLILQVGNWVLREACLRYQAMRQNGWPTGRLAVNISAVQVHHGDLVAQVRSAMAESGLPADCLELEVTEAVFAGDAALQTFHGLRDLGVQLAVDDFGTGFSSLAYLKYMPVQRLKIDQTFVRDMLADTANRAIVRSVVTLGQSLSLSVIAEGVENGELEGALLEEGCREGQGFYYARPMPEADLQRWIAERRQSGRDESAGG